LGSRIFEVTTPSKKMLPFDLREADIETAKIE
jgi:hypothetical protein